MFGTLFGLALLRRFEPQDPLWATFEGVSGPGKGKHVVFLAGDEEYRSEEGLPQLAKILSRRHGFKCTVLFSVGPDSVIDPGVTNNQPGTESLKTADVCVMLLRFRNWPDEQMAHFDAYLKAGKPIIGLRTSTHAFQYSQDETSLFHTFDWRSTEWPGGFGKQVLGETWLSHWGDHGKQATLGVVRTQSKGHPVLTGVDSLFGTSDVYEAHPPPDAQILIEGLVLEGLDRASAPAKGERKTATGEVRALNGPGMPIVWTRDYKNRSGTTNRVLTCTMGAATDFLDVGLRRLMVNSVYWATGLSSEIKSDINVDLVGTYKPSPFGFGGHRKGLKPVDTVKL